MPNIEMSFQLMHDPALGMFAFVSGNWSFAEQAIVTEAALGNLNGPARIQLGLKLTCHTLHGGRGVTYTRPTLAVLGTSLPSGPRGDVTSAADGAPSPASSPGRSGIELLDRGEGTVVGLAGLEPVARRI